MKKQVVVIHGGTSFKSYRDYFSHLKTKEVNIERLRFKMDWKSSLHLKLGKKYDVLLPLMPNSANARYKEWKIWFENVAKVLDDEVVLVGHSLGGIFLAKYLSENVFPKKIKAAILVAAPFEDDKASEDKESLAEFELPKSLKKFANQCDKIYLLYSQDDPMVPIFQLKKYKKALPKARTIIFKNRGHFNQEQFPEMVKIIKSL